MVAIPTPHKSDTGSLRTPYSGAFSKTPIRCSLSAGPGPGVARVGILPALGAEDKAQSSADTLVYRMSRCVGHRMRGCGGISSASSDAHAWRCCASASYRGSTAVSRGWCAHTRGRGADGLVLFQPSSSHMACDVHWVQRVTCCVIRALCFPYRHDVS